MLFRNLIAYKNTKESHIIDRKLAVKSSNSRSWVVHIKELLTKYDLSSAYKLNLSPPREIRVETDSKETCQRILD